MLVRLAMVIVALALSLPQVVSATTYYVRPNGSNSNSGTSWSSAWAHPNKGQSVMVAGDMLVIAPGAYDTVQFVPPTAGGAQTAYVCSTYTVNGSDAGRNNTFIRGGRQVALTWTSAGSNKWTATFASPMTGVSPRDVVALFRDGNVCDPRLSASEANSQNEYAYNTSSNVFTLYSTSNPSTSTWRVSWRPVMDTGPGQSNVLIFGLTIEEGSQRLIVIGDWDHSSPKPDSTYIKYCNLRKVIELENAHNGSIILSQTTDPTTASQWSNDLQVVGCSLSQVSTVDYANGTHAGVGIECYFVRDSRIDSNVFIGPMGSAIALKMGCYADNGVKSLNWSIKYNRISDCFDDAVWIGNKVGNLDFVGNIVERCEVGFNIHTSASCGNDPTQGNIKVLNNTFFNNDVNFTASAANSIGGNQIKYNIFFDTSGVVSDNYAYTLGFRLRGGEAPQETPSTETYWSNGINNNMYYIANGQTFVGRFMSNSGWAGQPTPTQAQWTAHFDQASVFGTNPKFAASNAGDYSRPSSTNEINVTHSGQTWTRYGAWQGSGAGCGAPGAVTLLTPANGATNLIPPIVFDWQDLSGGINYEIQVDNNSDFSSPEVDQYSTTSTYTVNYLALVGTYYWRVRGQDNCDWGTWSGSRSFTSACALPAVANLLLPADAALGLAQPVTLDWSDVSGATNYQFQVDDIIDFSSPVIDLQSASSTGSASSLTASTVYYWRVRSQNTCGWGNWSLIRSFTTSCSTPATPTLVSPANGATGVTNPAALDWGDVSGATNYQVQVDNDSNYSSALIDQQSATSGYAASGLVDATQYFWRVRAQNACGWGTWSASRTFTTSCVLPGTPVLATPANGAPNLAQPVALDWNDVATATNYQIQVDNNSDFSSVTIDQQAIASTYSASGMADGTTYYWRVRAQSVCGWGAWSASRFFSTICNLPAAPSFVSPANGATNLSQPLTLDWSDVATATSYQVQVDDNSDFSSVVVDQTPTASTQSVTGLTGGTTYYWRIRTQNGCGWGAWSASRTFSTIAVDSSAPTFTNVTAVNITENAALITWTTNEPATGLVNYGTTASYGSSSALNSTLATDHEQLLTGLTPLTTYHFRVRSRDAATNEGVSGDFTFITTEVLNNLDNGVPPTVSSTYSGYSASVITDGDLDPFGGTGSTWASTESATQPHWVEVDFGSSRQVKRVLVYWAWNGGQAHWMTSQQFRIQAWNGTAFTDVATVVNSTIDSCSFVDITPVTTNRLRYYQPANMGPATYPSVVWVSEMDVYGLTNTAPTVPGLSNPAAGGQVGTLTPTLAITNSTDTEGNTLTYEIQVSTSAAFSTIAAQATALAQGGGGATSWTVGTNLVSGNTYYWRARAYDGFLYSAYSTSRTFVVSVNSAPSVPTLASPVGGAQVGSLTPTLTINNSSDAEGNTIIYDFQVSTSSGFGSITAQANGVTQGGSGVTSWIVGTNLTNGNTYYWRSRAYDGALYSAYSAAGSFVVGVNSAPTVPGLSSPAAGAQVTTLTPTLTLTNSVDAEGNPITYDFQVSTSNTFGTIAVQATSVAQGGGGVTSWVVTSNLVNGTTYYWRVRAYDGSLYSSYAAYRSFSVSVNTAPTVPTLSSPAAGVQVTTITPTLTIGNATDAEGNTLTYDIQVSTSSTFGTITAQASALVQGGGGVTSWVVSPNLASGTTYYWRARSYDGVLYSSYAAYRSFSVLTNSAPTTPTLSSPAAAATVSTLTPTLIVNNSTDPDGNPLTYEFQVATSSAFSTIVAQVTAVAQGTGTTSWVVTPSLTYATTYYWRVRANDGALYSSYATYRSFTTFNNTAPGAPPPQAPTNGSRVIDMTPDLIVGNSTDANGDNLSYQFYLYNEATTVILAQSPMMSPGAGSTLWTTSITLSPRTKYTWRARANDGTSWSAYSPTRNFRTNRVPLTPVPSAPIDGDTVLGSMHQYVVLNASDPDGDSLTYDFETYSDSLLTILVESVLGVNPGPSQTSAISNVQLNPNQFYWWRCRANDSTHSSSWCEPEKFFQSQLVLDVTEAPSIVAPTIGQEINEAQPTLTISWSGAEDTSSCLFEISRTNNFESLVAAGSVNGAGTSASWATDQVLDQGEYFWRAKRGSSDFSVTANFSVVAAIYVSPNPFAYTNENIVVHNLPAGSRFEVYTSSGDQVMSVENLTGDFNWDVRNSSGEKLGSGVFLWYVRLSDKTVSGKLIVQR